MFLQQTLVDLLIYMCDIYDLNAFMFGVKPCILLPSSNVMHLVLYIYVSDVSVPQVYVYLTIVPVSSGWLHQWEQDHLKPEVHTRNVYAKVK